MHKIDDDMQTIKKLPAGIYALQQLLMSLNLRWKLKDLWQVDQQL